MDLGSLNLLMFHDTSKLRATTKPSPSNVNPCIQQYIHICFLYGGGNIDSSRNMERWQKKGNSLCSFILKPKYHLWHLFQSIFNDPSQLQHLHLSSTLQKTNIFALPVLVIARLGLIRFVISWKTVVMRGIRTNVLQYYCQLSSNNFHSNVRVPCSLALVITTYHLLLSFFSSW